MINALEKRINDAILAGENVTELQQDLKDCRE